MLGLESFARRAASGSKTLAHECVLVQPDGWARGEREGYGGPCDVTSLSLSHLSKLTSLHHYNTTDHYAIEWICSAQNELFKTVLRAVRAAASRSPHRSVKF